MTSTSLDSASTVLRFPERTVLEENSSKALISQSLLQARRILVSWSRDRSAIIQALLYPTVMMVMFRVVLGGSIDATASFTAQRGIFGTVPMMCLIGAMAGSSISALGLQRDRETGLLSRFATMPVNRASDLVGRLIAESGRLVVTIALILGVGFLLGFRFENGLLSGLGMPVVILVYGMSFVMAMTAIATIVKGPQIVMLVMVFTTLMMFFNTGFVPLMAYPQWLQPIVDNQPVSCAVNAMRALTDSYYPGSLAEPLIKTLLWSAALLGISIRAAVVGYHRSAAE